MTKEVCAKVQYLKIYNKRISCKGRRVDSEYIASQALRTTLNDMGIIDDCAREVASASEKQVGHPLRDRLLARKPGVGKKQFPEPLQ